MTAPGRELESSQATATGFLAAAELARGDVIAQRYRIEQMLGIGGMGVVYRAQDLQLDVPIALKLLRPELAARPDAFARFRQELLLARQVSSPHVVRIHDLVQHGSMWLISMDYVPGASLEKRLDLDGPMPAEQALKIVRQVALGLGAAHDSGVVHRDLKPANILVTDTGEAFISDFGVARAAGQTGVTGTGVVVGTPEYLSPEQARAERVDGRSDLYTLGLILYELISGQLPFHGSTAAESLAQRIVRSPPPLKQVKPDVAAWIDRLCGRLLALKPAHRLANAQAVVEAIDRRRVGALPGRWPRRAALALLGVALLGGGYWWWQRPVPAAQEVTAPSLDLVVLPVQAPADANAATRQFAQGLSHWLWDALAASKRRSADPERMHVLLRQLGFDAASAARNAAQVRAALPNELMLAPRLVRDGEQWRLLLPPVEGDTGPTVELNLPEAAQAQWRETAALLGSQTPPADWPGRKALTVLGAAPDDLRTAPAVLEAVLQIAPNDAAIWREALRLSERRALPNESATLAERALVALGKIEGHDAAVARAQAQLLLGDAAAAERELAPRRDLAPSDLPMQRLWARVQAELHGPEAALEPLRQVVRLDPQNLRGWFQLGRYTLSSGDARRALDDYLVRALVIALRVGDELTAAETRNAMGVGYERLGQTQAAVEHFTLAADARERLGDAIGAAASLRNLAAAEAVRGGTTAAEAALDRAGTLLKDIDAPLAQADLHNDRGLLAEERGDFGAALVAYRDALALRQAAGIDVAESQYNVGFAYFQVGEFDNALVYWRQAEAEYAKQQDEPGRLRAQQALALIDNARGAWNEARKTLDGVLATAEARQMSEELAVGLSYLSDLDRLQGRIGASLERADRSGALFAQRQDRRGSLHANLLRVAALLDVGDWEGAETALAQIPVDDEVSAEQRAQHALRQAQLALGRAQFDAAAEALARAGELATQAHSQPLAIESELVAAQLATLRQDAPTAVAALQRARDGLERFAPLALSLQTAETTLLMGQTDSYETTLGLLRRAPDYGRAYAIHHAAARALAAAGDAVASQAAQQRWQQARDGLRAQLPESLHGHFDQLAAAQPPVAPVRADE